MALLSPFTGVPIVRFLTITNRHAVAPSDIFFTQVSFFLCQKMQKNDDRLCPLPYVYEEVLEAIIYAVWTEQCENV